MKRKGVVVFTALAMAGLIVALVGCNKKEAQGSSASAEVLDTSLPVQVWGWDNSATRQKMVGQFTQDTGIKIDMVVIPSADILQKVQTTMASGGDMPDIVWMAQRGKLINMDVWQDITKAPYNFDKGQVLDYLLPIETAEDGRYIGPESLSVAGMAYKRDLAKEYFGTDDPLELEKLLPNWDAFIKAGEEVRRKSGGKVFMLTSLGLVWNALSGQTTEPFINGTKLSLDDSLKPILQRLIDFKKAGIVDVIDTGSPAENASYATNEHIFYPCANWSVVYTIKGNDPNGKGRWGFMLPPGGPFPWGGNTWGVPKNAKNKMGGVAYITWTYQDVRGAIQQRDVMGNFSPYKKVYEDQNFYSRADEHFANQDVLKAIATRVVPNITGVRAPSRYDEEITQGYNAAIAAINASPNGNISVDTLIKQVADDIVNRQPAITR